MTDVEYSRTLEELERLLNDPDVPMQADRIWSLLEGVSGQCGASSASHQPPSRSR